MTEIKELQDSILLWVFRSKESDSVIFGTNRGIVAVGFFDGAPHFAEGRQDIQGIIGRAIDKAAFSYRIVNSPDYIFLKTVDGTVRRIKFIGDLTAIQIRSYNIAVF